MMLTTIVFVLSKDKGVGMATAGEEESVQETCGRCYQKIKGTPKEEGGLFFHEQCNDDGIEALKRARDIAARYGYKVTW